MFTSFGYFLDDAEHRLVVGQVAAAQQSGVTRRLGADGRFVIKEIELRDEGRRFQERVPLYVAARA